MRSISMTIAHPAAQVAGCSGALRLITVGAENARSRVLAGPSDSGCPFVSKCFHCACSVSHERGPNACSDVTSPPPPRQGYLLAKYFAAQCTGQDQHDDASPAPFPQSFDEPQFNFPEILLTTVYHHLRRLPTAKSTADRLTTNRVLRECAPSISSSLA